MRKTKPIYFVFAGMLAGAMAGFLLFYHLDQSKGWNHYGWWFPATFITSAAGGLTGVFIGDAFHKRRKKR